MAYWRTSTPISHEVEQFPREMHTLFRRRDQGRLAAASPHALGDLEGARRILAEAKRVEHLVDDDGLRERRVLDLELCEAAVEDSDACRTDVDGG